MALDFTLAYSAALKELIEFYRMPGPYDEGSLITISHNEEPNGS